MTQHPPPLDYSSGRFQPSEPEGSWGSFALGAVAGLLFSIAYYTLMIQFSVFDKLPFVGFGAVVIKVLAGLRLMRVPRWRKFGIGVIASIPLAVLILVGICFTILAKI
jgi:hypothetical protein